MSDRWAIAVAVAAAAGALRPSGAALWLAGALAGAALLVRRPLVLCVGVALLTSCLGQRALDGLHGVRAGPLSAVVTLLSDPTPSARGLRADVRLGRRHVELDAAGSTVAALAPRLAGERVRVSGELAPVVGPAPWLVVRHVAARLRAGRIEAGPPPGTVAAFANRLRRALSDGSALLRPIDRSLFTGLVIGDDRDQPATLTDDFRGAGLTHLLAVSGENVAFVLALVAPLGRRLRLWPRLGLVLVVVALFALMTRFEPSVSRAAVMAAIAAITVTMGRPIARVRVLALAVTVLLIVDPLLVGALGFQLSVAATLAITTLGPAVSAALPGPSWCTDPLGVTISAQLGVAPLLLAAYGPLPVASLPANLLAVPAAGAVMVWGMTAGIGAGLVGGGVAAALHLPTRVLLGWIGQVAERAAGAPLGQVGLQQLVVATTGLALLVVGSRWRRRSVRVVGGVLAAGGVLVAVVAAQVPPPLRTEPSPGIVRWHGPATDVVVLGGGSWRSPLGPDGVLAALRTAGVRSIALLVLVDDAVAPGVVDAVVARHPTGTILASAGRRTAGLPARTAVLPFGGADLDVGALHVTLVPAEGRLVVEAWPSPR